MKKVKVLLCLLLAITLCGGLLAGCGNKNGDSSAVGGGNSGAAAADGAPAGPVETVVLYLVTFNNIPDDYTRVSDAINSYIAETYPEARVALDLRLIGPAEYNDKIKLAMQSGTQMDLFVPLDLQSFIAQNMCLDIGPYLEEYGKGLTEALYRDFGDDAFNIVTQNGSVYGVPINKAVVITPTLSYHKEMLEATSFTIDDINSIWDLTDVYAEIKELFPDVYPFATTNIQDPNLSLIWYGEKKVDRLGESNSAIVAIGEDSTVLNFFDTDIFREYCDLMREWYLAGYVAQDMATSTTNAAEYAAAGRMFSSWASYSGVLAESDNSVFNSLVGTDAFGSKWIAPVYMDTRMSGLTMCVSSNTKVPEASMKLMDIIYTDEFVINTILYGLEGEDYVKVSEHVVAFPEGLDANSVPYTAYLCNGVIGSERLMWTMTSEEDYENKILALEMNKTVDRSAFYGFTFDGSKVVNELTAITNVIQQYYPGLVCGSVDPETTIPQFVAALEDAGINKVIAEKQEQLDAWIAENK